MAGLGATSSRSSREVVNLHTDIFDFLCTFHRVRRLPSKDTNPGAIANDEKTSDEQRGELINRYLYKILNEIELRISALEITSEPATTDFYDEWTFLTWTLLSILNRLQSDTVESRTYLDYRGKHFREMINSAIVELVNRAQRMQPPEGVPQNQPSFERFYQAYVSTLISLHHLMNRQPLVRPNGHLNTQFYSPHGVEQLTYAEFQAQVELLKEQMSNCFRAQREFCNNHNSLLWQRMRESQLRKMTEYEYEDKEFMAPSTAFYSNVLYNFGVMAARLQGFYHELRSNNVFTDETDVMEPLLRMVYTMVEALLCDALLCVEPSQNTILVTNNLFPMKIVSLCRCVFFRDFSLQIVSEEVAQQIQQEMRQRKAIDPGTATAPITSLIWPPASAALLAMKPSSGVKRNNATASAEGGNTAHKKSDVNSKEWISIPPFFDSEHQCWIATHPHLLCTTRQKDTLLDARSASQTGKRPLFYFHVKAEMFGFSGRFSTAHTLSLPFTIATRRNQDCQVQRMMSSYTATCFWLYGTKILNGFLIQWYDNEIEWKHFKVLYAKYFSLNAEVRRTLVDNDFNVLRYKMHCYECTDHDANSNPDSGFNVPKEKPLMVSFKNVLCPHLHYTAGKVDLHFSIWRGMLELQHLFSDQRTDVKTLWENGLLQGFMDPEKVHNHLQAVESGLVMRLSFVMGCCVCFSVKSSSQVLNLEPLDVRRLQSKSLHEYLRDILTAEKVKYVLNVNEKWIHVNDVIKICQQISTLDSYNQTSKEVKSNAMSTGSVELEQTFRFTPMRVAVVTCKQPVLDDGKLDVSSTTFPPQISSLSQEKNNDMAARDAEGFAERLDALLAAYGKSRTDLLKYTRGHFSLIESINAPENESGNDKIINVVPSSSENPSVSVHTSVVSDATYNSNSKPAEISNYASQHSQSAPQHLILASCCYSQPFTSQQLLTSFPGQPLQHHLGLMNTSSTAFGPPLVTSHHHYHQLQPSVHYMPNYVDVRQHALDAQHHQQSPQSSAQQSASSIYVGQQLQNDRGDTKTHDCSDPYVRDSLGRYASINDTGGGGSARSGNQAANNGAAVSYEKPVFHDVPWHEVHHTYHHQLIQVQTSTSAEEGKTAFADVLTPLHTPATMQPHF